MESAEPMAGERGAQGRRWIEILAAAGTILFRLAVIPFSRIWRDWIVILGLFWIAAILQSKSRRWPWISGVFVSILLAIYFSGHLPLILVRLGLGGE